MDKVVIEIYSILKMKLDLKEFPELTSKNKLASKAIEIIKKGMPKLLRYLSKEDILSKLSETTVEIHYYGKKDDNHILRAFRLWLQEQKAKRLTYIIIESIILPLMIPLAILPGPNFFFYVPFVFLYFHGKTYLSMRKIKFDTLKYTIIRMRKDTQEPHPDDE